MDSRAGLDGSGECPHRDSIPGPSNKLKYQCLIFQSFANQKTGKEFLCLSFRQSAVSVCLELFRVINVSGLFVTPTTAANLETSGAIYPVTRPSRTDPSNFTVSRT